MRLPTKTLLLVAGGAALVPSYAIMSDCDSSDTRQSLGLFVLPSLAMLCFATAGWLWPVDATTGQKLGVALFCGLFLGAIAWGSVVAVWVARCEG